MSELKKCPFCGDAPYVGKTEAVGCVTNGCPIAGDAMTIEQWNMRLPEDAQITRIAELEKQVEARGFANQLLEQERDEISAGNALLREALKRDGRGGRGGRGWMVAPIKCK